MTAIKDVQFMRWCPRENVFSFVCMVTYASGRLYKFYGRTPATVRRYIRERAFSHPLPPCYCGYWCEARKLEGLFEVFENGEVSF